MTRLRLFAVLASLVAAPLVVARPADADVPPPPGYVETCTVEQQQTNGARCEACRAGYQDANACATRFASTQLRRRCRTSGASSWTEVWCENRIATDPTVPAPGTSPGPAPAPSPEPAPAPGPARPPETSPATSVSAEEAAAEVSCAVAAPGAARASGLALVGLAAVLAGVARRRARR